MVPLPYSPRRQSLQHLQTPPHEVRRNCDTQRNLRKLNDPFPSRHHPFPSRPDFHLRTEPADAHSKSSGTQRVKACQCAKSFFPESWLPLSDGARSWSAHETTVGRNFRSERSIVDADGKLIRRSVSSAKSVDPPTRKETYQMSTVQPGVFSMAAAPLTPCHSRPPLYGEVLPLIRNEEVRGSIPLGSTTATTGKVETPARRGKSIAIAARSPQ